MHNSIGNKVVFPEFCLLIKSQKFFRKPKKIEAAAPQPDEASDEVPTEKVSTVFGILAKKKSFWLLSFGASMSTLCGYGIAFWLPSLIQRSFGLDLIGTSQFYGAKRYRSCCQRIDHHVTKHCTNLARLMEARNRIPNVRFCALSGRWRCDSFILRANHRDIEPTSPEGSEIDIERVRKGPSNLTR